MSVSAYPNALGRESQALATLIGLKDELSLLFDVDKNVLVPKGLAGELAKAANLATQAPSEDLLKLLPVDAPVVALLSLNLPETLDAESMAAHLKGEGGKTSAREVAIVWTPHGNAESTDVALVWGHTKDEVALAKIFSGPNPVVTRKMCNHLVIAAAESTSVKLEAACKGSKPSRQNAAPAIVAGAKSPLSIGLQIHSGALLSQLMEDAFESEQRSKKSGKTPPEIQQAKTSLETLPFFGFIGKASGTSLVPEGFRS
jgi:hypothetical protein